MQRHQKICTQQYIGCVCVYVFEMCLPTNLGSSDILSWLMELKRYRHNYVKPNDIKTQRLLNNSNSNSNGNRAQMIGSRKPFRKYLYANDNI